MMTVEKMAKVVSEINRGLANSGPRGVEGASHVHTNSDPTCVCAVRCKCTYDAVYNRTMSDIPLHTL